MDTLALLAKGVSLLDEKPEDVAEWARADTASFGLIRSAASAKDSRLLTAVCTLLGGAVAFVAGFVISDAAGDCEHSGQGVECHNPAGAIVSAAGLIAIGTSGWYFFTDPPQLRALRNAYFYHRMQKRMNP